MNEANEVFTSTMEWLREHYADYTFFQERDVVPTVQLQLLHAITSRQYSLPAKDRATTCRTCWMLSTGI